MKHTDIGHLGPVDDRPPIMKNDSLVHTQVYLDTHDGADKRLPHRERSFISFTYGGKSIEDFYLIATLRGDRMERQLYGDFSDNTSTYDVIDGQFYWGSHYTTNKLELQLSTDEITEQQLQDFKAWFTPGEGKELVLAEYPNRGIWARVSQVPEYHMLPFEKKIQKKFAGNTYTISTTVYRGDIDIEFVMDDPFWYSIYNVLPSYGQDGAEDWFKTLGIAQENNTADENSLMANKDYLKIILEDGVPTKEMFQAVSPVITGNEVHNVSEKPTAISTAGGTKVGNAIAGGKKANTNEYIQGSRLFSVSIKLSKDGANSTAYLYYTGSAPAPTILSFDLIPEIQDGYICQPWNKIYNKVAENSGQNSTPNNYNTITIGKQEFRFTTPSLYTGYNQAMDIVTSVPEGTSTIDLHILLNEGVNEYYSRSWALGILNYIKAFKMGVDLETSQINNRHDFIEAFKNMMRKFLDIRSGGTIEQPQYSIKPASFKFNSKTGVSTGTFNVRKFTDEGLDQWDKLARYKGAWNVRLKLRQHWITDAESINNNDYSLITAESPITRMEERGNDWGWLLYNAGFDMLDENGEYLFTVKPFMDYTEETIITENVGDMIYGKYLYLNEKNLYNDEGYIYETECTPITTDYPNNNGGLQNFDIQYKHMYL